MAGARGPAAAADWNVTHLMQSLAQQRGGKVAFSEKKYIALLDRPVESSGELVYQPPARLEKRTLKPNAESLVLDRDVLVVERGKQKYTLQLQQYPEITAIVGIIRNTLAGDLEALQRQYRVDLQGSPERWSLTLLPSDARIAAMVQRIQISGTRDEVRQVEMLQADGDRSVMQIHRDGPP
ncbi:MAG: outer membrane lipoprotein carrier protein LolA [Pseudomonadota bacterium]|nr:outer membrane lipoprotein carrier protein LolA [Pseudomonadota bacterium]